MSSRNLHAGHRRRVDDPIPGHCVGMTEAEKEERRRLSYAEEENRLRQIREFTAKYWRGVANG